MEDDYGIRIGKAFRAIDQLHNEIRHLFRDCDRLHSPEWESVFATKITRDVGENLDAGTWMPEGVYRYYYRKAEPPDCVESVMICFFDRREQRRFAEPLLLVARFYYNMQIGAVAEVCRAWDTWNAFFHWVEAEKHGYPYPWREVISSDYDSKRITASYMLAVPLFEVTCSNDIRGFIERLRSCGRNPVVPKQS
ncbi:MAG: hypothetical protein HYU36_18110 [Planctomycetes bacterium]|nr:hypothetical protein [Planctomycetota bacterium]